MNSHVTTMVVGLGALVWAMRQAAGKKAGRVAGAPLVFLVTRWPVMAAWAAGSTGMLALMIPQMHAKGTDTPGHLAMVAAIALFGGGGVAAMTVGPVFLAVRAFAKAPVVELGSGERVVDERLGSHFLRSEGRGGKLLVTSERVAFRPHRFNVQLDTWSMALADVARVEVEGARLVILHGRDGTEPQWVMTTDAEAFARLCGRAHCGHPQ